MSLTSGMHVSSLAVLAHLPAKKRPQTAEKPALVLLQTAAGFE